MMLSLKSFFFISNIRVLQNNNGASSANIITEFCFVLFSDVGIMIRCLLHKFQLKLNCQEAGKSTQVVFKTKKGLTFSKFPRIYISKKICFAKPLVLSCWHIQCLMQFMICGVCACMYNSCTHYRFSFNLTE